MTSLIEVVLTFVGVMLVLALVAQSVQEVIKASFGLKGGATFKALERLLIESARSHGYSKTDAEAVADDVRRRLRALGQKGIRPNAVRLDAITPAQLGDLIKLATPKNVPGLKAFEESSAGGKLDKIAERAVEWYPLAMVPVDDRYRRRMRGLALVSSAIVVLAVNADAFKLMDRARRDPQFRARVAALTAKLETLERRAEAAATPTTRVITSAAVDTTTRRDTSVRRDTTARRTASASQPTGVATVNAARDSATALALAALGDESFIGGPKDWRPGSYAWWVGILLSIALVSLGAPFWHDTLEAMFGLKSRLRAQAKQLEQSTPTRATDGGRPVVAPPTPTLSGPVQSTRPAAGGGGASSG